MSNDKTMLERQQTIGTALVWTHVLVLISFETACTSLNTQQDLTTIGTEFMLGILGTTTLPDAVVLNIVSTSTSNVHITSPFSNLDLHYKVMNFLCVNVSGEFSIRSEGSTHKGLFVQSDVPISVTVIPHGYHDLHEGFMALPVNVLSTEYIAESFQPYPNPLIGNGELLIVGIEDATVVNISGMEFKSQLIQRYETLQFVYFMDISGTFITSNKPVAVFSGSSNSQVPLGTGDHQYLVEQLIPVDLWGNIYVIPPLYPRTHYLVRIFPSLDNTTVIFASKTENINRTVDLRGSFLEHVIDNGPALVMSSKPVSVMQYLFETFDAGYGDPFMTTVQSVTQFRHSYTFTTGLQSADYVNVNVTLSVTIKTIDADHLLLYDKDGTLITPFVNVGQVHGYSALAVNLTYGNFYSIHHTDNKPFGLLLYGLPNQFVGFGYPVAMNFTRHDGSETVTTSTLPSKAVTTSTTSTTEKTIDGSETVTTSLQPSKAVTTSTTSTTEKTMGNSSWCFDCIDMSHLKYCDKVKRCVGEDQVCFVQGYMRSLNVKLYKSGCIDKKLCQPKGQTDCLQCCEGSFCNTQGCGDNGINDLVNRGPMCFDCNHRGENDICKTVQLCAPNEKCIVEKYEWGTSDFHYVQGCATSCGLARKSVLEPYKKRHVPFCTKCCSSDFCNDNCTAAVSPAIIG